MDHVLFNVDYSIILLGLVILRVPCEFPVVFQHENDIGIMLEVHNNQISIEIATYFPL